MAHSHTSSTYHDLMFFFLINEPHDWPDVPHISVHTCSRLRLRGLERSIPVRAVPWERKSIILHVGKKSGYCNTGCYWTNLCYNSEEEHRPERAPTGNTPVHTHISVPGVMYGLLERISTLDARAPV